MQKGIIERRAGKLNRDGYKYQSEVVYKSCLKQKDAEIARHFIQSARVIAVLTVVSRVLGLVRDAVLACYIGPSILHYFYLAWQVPNLFRRLFGEGALSAALIPIYTRRLQEDEKDAGLLVRRVLTLLLVILLVLTGVGLLVVGGIWQVSGQGRNTALLLKLTAIMLPYLVLVCMVAALGGILNVHHRFAAPAAAPIVLNICLISAVLGIRHFIGDDPWSLIYWVAAAVLIAGMLQVGLQVYALRRVKVSLQPLWQPKDEYVRRMLHLMGPMVVGLSVVQFNTLLDNLIAYFLSANPESGPSFVLWGREIAYPVVEGSITYLSYAQRLYQFPLGVFGVALATAIFPSLSHLAGRRDREGFSRTFSEGVRMVLFIALPATVGLIIVRMPLIRLWLERGRFQAADSASVAWTLLFYALGMTAYFLQQLVVRAYYSYQDSRTPVKVAVRMVGLNFVLNMVLIWWLGTGGLALSTAGCATIQAVVLLVIFTRRYEIQISRATVISFWKSAAATLVMGIGGWLVMRQLQNYAFLVQLVVVVAACIILYGGMSMLLRQPEMKMLIPGFKRRSDGSR